MAQKSKLIPVDLKQCQAEKPSGNTFMTMGGSINYVNCENKPVVIVTEMKKGKDGVKGSMSLCKECWKVAIKQLGDDFFVCTPIGDNDE